VLLAYPVWLVRLAVWHVRNLLSRRGRRPHAVSFLVEAPPPEPAAPPAPFWQRRFSPAPLTIHELRQQMRAVTAEPRVQVAVLHLRPIPLSAAQVDALRELIAEVRAGGVRVVCWAPSYTSATYHVACAANEVLLQPDGVVGPLGVAREYVFLADSLQRVGVRADLLAISPYKTAGDMLTQRGFTPEAREMAEWLTEAAYEELASAVASGRKLDDRGVGGLIDGSPFIGEQALEAGAVDGVVTEEDLPDRLGGEVQAWSTARRRLPRPRPVRPGRVVALLRVQGMIVDGRSRRPPLRLPMAPPLVFGDQSGDLTVAEQARALALDRRVAAVVLWVDSPGGSGSASEAMAAALGRLARQKPLVVAMGSAAASGGYYVSTAARKVFAHPGTITGSIGVIGGKVVTAGLFDRLLVHRESVRRGEHADMWNPDRPFTDIERRKLRELIEHSYALFRDRVAAARGRQAPEIEQVAGGRVWTGRQALDRGLVDELGGLERAVVEARRLGGLPAEAQVREVRGARRELMPAPAGTAALLAHALSGLQALNQAATWWLCPLDL
jgi:protease-4